MAQPQYDRPAKRTSTVRAVGHRTRGASVDAGSLRGAWYANARRRCRDSSLPSQHLLRIRPVMTSRFTLAVVALWGCAGTVAHAQTVSSGRIDGTVTDSVHARPLTGVRVVA